MCVCIAVYTYNINLNIYRNLWNVPPSGANPSIPIIMSIYRGRQAGTYPVRVQQQVFRTIDTNDGDDDSDDEGYEDSAYI